MLRNPAFRDVFIMTNSEPSLEIAWTNLFYPREFKKQLFVTVSASIMNCLGCKSPLRSSPTKSLFQDHVSKPRDKLRGKVSAEWGVCTSVCGIIIGEQTETVFILQKAKVPHGSVREQSWQSVCWKHVWSTVPGHAAPALAAGLSLAELALGYQPQQRVPCGGFYPVPQTSCSPSPYLDWGSV